MLKSPLPRVHWVSPIPPAETDIAHYTTRILPELAAVTDLVLWTDAREWDPMLEDYCQVRYLDPDHVSSRDFADPAREDGRPEAVFVHIGNSWVFHSGLLRLVRRIPSVIVLHDLAIQELCREAILNGLFDEQTYRAEMARWHGDHGAECVNRLFEGKISALDVAREIPGFEIVLDRAAAVLTHTATAFEAVKSRDAVTTYQLDLPFRPSTAAPSAHRNPEGPLRFVQFGYIGPNRRLEEVLEALAPLRDEVAFRFDIMGNVWDTAYIQERINSLGLTQEVKIHGFVPEPELDKRLANAHLIFNLRHPTMGEASGSQLRIWNACAAAVVTEDGWYGSLPDDTVFKIPLSQERTALQDLVRRLAADRKLCEQIGAAGRAQLEARHTPALYAEGVSYIAGQFPVDARMSLFARCARRVIGNTSGQLDLLRRALASKV